MGKKRLSIALVMVSLVLALVLSISLISCAKPSPTPTPTPSPAPSPTPTPTPKPSPTPTPTPTVKPIAIKINSFGSPRAYTNGFHLFWGPELEKRSNGRVKVEFFWEEALGPQKEQTTNIGSGLFEAGPCVPSVEIGRLPLSNIAFLPTLEPNCYVLGVSIQEFATLPLVKAQFDKLNTVFMFGLQLGDYALNAHMAYKTTDDFKGKRIRGLGDQNTLLKELGATPVAITTPEVFGALEKKSIDGVIFTWDSMNIYGTADVAKFVTNVHFGAGCANFLINKDFYNKLPADIQKIINDLNVEYAAVSWKQWQAEDVKILAKWKTGGVNVSEFPQAEWEKMRKISVEKIWPGWAKSMDEKGLQGQFHLNALLKMLEKNQVLIKK